MNTNIHTHVGIVADDLTSATDGSAPFLAKGYEPLTIQNDSDLMHAPVVAIDTQSRAAPVTQAAGSTASAIRALCDCPILLKTIDSTLRGHIREEIAAAFQASGRKRLIIAPAFPYAGRLTVGGYQIVHGTPVSTSDYGSDPVHPAKTSRIADLIDDALGSPVVLGVDASEEISRQAASARIVILDADSQETLNKRVACVPDPETVLWVGSPGLAIALASLFPSALKKPQVAHVAIKRTLIVAGSANPITHAQCDALRAGKIPVVTDLAKAPFDAPVVCLHAPRQRQQDTGLVLKAMIEQVSVAVLRSGFDSIIATGGETMAAILNKLGISHFILVRELEPGFPLGLAQLADGTGLTIAMKGGGFGSPSTLLNAVKVITLPEGYTQ